MNSKEIATIQFIERLRKINSDLETRTVWECIDRPIRPLVFELARIGMIPKFSCCGFTYDGEEEPKTHYHINSFGPYIHYYVPDNEVCVSNYKKLDNLAKIIGWKSYYWQHGIFEIKLKNCVPDDMYMKNDGISESIHQYEAYALGIFDLTYNIQERIETVNDVVEIVDGNFYYLDIKEWQVKPKQRFIISVDDYYNTYGKLHKNINKPSNIYIPEINFPKSREVVKA